MSTVDPIPPGPRLIPSLIVADAAAALDFYVRAFGFEETMRLKMKDGRIGHAELRLGTGEREAQIHLADEFPEMQCTSPTPGSGTPVGLRLYVHDVDAAVAAALEAGATLEGEVKDEFYGDRVARLRDPFGHRWTLHTRIEALSDEELERRFAKLEA